MPRSRYLIGADALGWTAATTVMPAFITDALKGATVGMNPARVLWPRGLR